MRIQRHTPFTIYRRALLALCLALFTGAWHAGGALRPLTTDGCSLFPEGTLKEKNLWHQCCVEHDRAYWLGDMTPRETGRLLEAIERGTLTSKTSPAEMKTILGRQQAGSRRIPHFLDVPVAHKTGDSGVIANDVALVSARSGTVID